MITATYHNMLNIVNKLFGGLGSKNLKTYDKIVKKINDFETEISKLDDQELKNKTQYFKNQLDEKQKTIDDILPEAFAVVREASKRTLKMRHFDVQHIGGIVLCMFSLALRWVFIWSWQSWTGNSSYPSND